MLVSIARRILPIKTRQTLGCWMLNQTSKSKLLLYLYLYALHSKFPQNLQLLPHREARYRYSDYDIVSPRDGIGSFLEVFQDEVYDSILKPEKGNIVVDIGAYVGMFTVKALLAVGDRGHVIAFEPDTVNYNYLLQNTEPFFNKTAIQKALSDKEETREFYLSRASACHSMIYSQSLTTQIETATLDDILASMGLIEEVDFIKIDAEGAELEVLKGSERVLSYPPLKLAIASYHSLPDGTPEIPLIVSFLEERGFKIIKAKGLREYVYACKVIETV